LGIAGVAAIAVLALLAGLASIYRKVPANKALIVYGQGGTSIVTGGGRLIIPVFQGAQELSLELMSFDVAPDQDCYTSQGVAVSVEAVTQIKVKNDIESIRTAAEQFLGKSSKDQENQIKLVMEGHLRGIVGQLTVEDIVKKPEEVATLVLKNVAEDLSKMGLSIVSFTIKKVSDEQDYIKNMGRPDVARIKLAAEIAEAEAAREIASKKAEAMRQAAEAQAQADQARVAAQAASEAKQAEAVRDLNLKKAEYDAEVNQKKAVAEKAYEISQNQAEQRAVAEKVKISQVEKQEQIRLQELEVQRRELELQSTMIKQSDAEKRRIEIMAEAEAARQIREAQGRAEAAKAEADAARLRGLAEADVAKARGQAEAEVVRSKGQAEADVVAAKGAAEAEAMQKRADAYAQYNQAAILDRVLASLPDMAQAFSESLAKVDKITIVSTGDSKSGGGASALTGEVAKMIAQVPTVVESLTGIDVNDLLRKVPAAVDTQKAQPIVVEAEEAK
jgi:flotillin